MPSPPEKPVKPATTKRDLWLTIAGSAFVLTASALYWWFRERK